MQIFRSLAALIKWVTDVGKMNGFVINILKSYSGGAVRRKSSLTLRYERSGRYRVDNRSKNVCVGAEVKEVGTKKCECSFRLKDKKLSTDDDWMLEVVCGMHNHSAVNHLECHSFADRLSKEEYSLLKDMSKSNTRPKYILVTMKQRDPLNTTTMKSVYNARHKYKLEENGGSQMQQLLALLAEHQYIEWHRTSENSEAVTDLFWANSFSLDLLRAFPHVLLIDCMYKTNRYRMLLLEIVGLTSTDITFSVAFVYLQHEREDNFNWALDVLCSIMDDSALPNIIVTDRELALMNVISRVFSTATHLLYR